MYKITEVRELNKLPENMSERNHVSQYILNNSIETTEGDLMREKVECKTHSSVVIFKVNDVEVWAKTEEALKWLEVLPKVKDNKISGWHIATGGTPYSDTNSKYELHLLYNI